jgi:hypothetical protein
MLLVMTKTWGSADFIYAIDRLEIDQGHERRDLVLPLYRRLMAEHETAEARVKVEEAKEQRHKEMTYSLEELKTPHWSTVPNFWITVAILVLTAIGAVASVLALFRK